MLLLFSILYLVWMGTQVLLDTGTSREQLISLAPNGKLEKMFSKGRPPRLKIAVEVNGGGNGRGHSSTHSSYNNNGSPHTSSTNRGPATSSSAAVSRRQSSDSKDSSTGARKQTQNRRRTQNGASASASASAVLAEVEMISKSWVRLSAWDERCEHLTRLTAAVKSNPKGVVAKLFVVMDVYQVGMGSCYACHVMTC